MNVRPYVACSVVFVVLLGSPLAVTANNIEPSAPEVVFDSSANSIYPASFFTQYLPQNALEMIQRLPGFNFDQGSNARGFGGNAGNVLIDGARPTSKSGGLRAALVRMPATQVVRIEIIRGGISSAEAAGQSTIANIIRKKSGSSGSWAFKQRWVNHLRIKPNLEAAMTNRIGVWDAAFDIDIGGFPGYRSADIETSDAQNQLLSIADERLTEVTEFLFINGEGARDIGDGRLTLNARVGGNRRDEDTDREIFTGSQTLSSTRDQFWELGIDNEFSMAELAIDWNRTRNDWKWRLIGLGLVEDRQFDNQFHFETAASGDFFDSSFSQDSLNKEFIARTTYGRVAGAVFQPEFGVEIANNKLTSGSVSFLDGVQQQLNGGNVEVEELRGEIFATFVYPASVKLTLDGGLTAEISNIKVSGDSGQEQTLKFLKPRLSATYKFHPDQQLVLELERRVGQLNFNDFAASSQVSDDRTTSGNPDLKPDQTTEVALTYDWSFSERGSLKIKAFHQWQEDILEQILLPSGGQGIGNAGDARFWGIQTDLNLPLDPLLKNGLLEISHFYNDSSFDDPLTGRGRTINGYTPNWFTFLLRQDITEQKLAWGIEYWGSFTDTNFFVDERQTFSGNKRWRIFVESSQFFDIKTTLEVVNVNTAEFTRTRFIYADDRGGSFQGTEIARRLRKPQVTLVFSNNF